MSIRELLEDAYKQYPRKLGKSQGMRNAIKSIRTKEDVENLKKAIEKYRRYIANMNTETQYIMYFSTFMNQWRDWLDEETGSSITSAKKDKWSALKERA